MQEAEAINSQVEGIESKMDGSFPLLMENVSWFQQYQEGSPVAVPNPEAPVCSQHHSAARHSNAPPDDPPPPGERQAQPQRTMALRCPCPSIHDTQRPNIGGAFQLDATGSLVKRHRRLGCGYFGPLSQCCQCCEWRVRDQCSRMPVVTGVHGVVLLYCAQAARITRPPHLHSGDHGQQASLKPMLQMEAPAPGPGWRSAPGHAVGNGDRARSRTTPQQTSFLSPWDIGDMNLCGGIVHDKPRPADMPEKITWPLVALF